MNRRTLLTASGTALTTSFVGCLSDSSAEQSGPASRTAQLTAEHEPGFLDLDKPTAADDPLLEDQPIYRELSKSAVEEGWGGTSTYRTSDGQEINEIKEVFKQLPTEESGQPYIVYQTQPVRFNFTVD